MLKPRRSIEVRLRAWARARGTSDQPEIVVGIWAVEGGMPVESKMMRGRRVVVVVGWEVCVALRAESREGSQKACVERKWLCIRSGVGVMGEEGVDGGGPGGLM